MASDRPPILILHEWSGETYFQALDALARAPGGPGIEYREIMLVRQMAVGVVRRNLSLVKKSLRNLAFWVRSFTLRGRVVVLGLAPCDPSLVFWLHLLRRNTVVYHTSWTEWDGTRFARSSPVLRRWVEAKWRAFLEDPRVPVVSILQESRRALLAHYRKDPSGLHVIPHTVDMAVFRPPAAPPRNRRLKVAYVGRLAKVKGIDVLAEIIRRADPERFEFTVVGDGPELKTLQPLLGRPNLAFHGYVGDKARIAALIADHDAMVMPSVSEQFGIALIEGMACGQVPLASVGLVPKDLVYPGENGFILERSAEAFLAALESLEADRGLLETLRAKALAKAREYDMPAVQARWRDFLAGLQVPLDVPAGRKRA